MNKAQSKLLVSVRSVTEALAALKGGADLIDVKEPTRGSLGKADDQTIADIVQAVGSRRPVSAAMGELAFTPTALHPIAQGCRASSYPGTGLEETCLPRRGYIHDANEMQPLRGSLSHSAVSPQGSRYRGNPGLCDETPLGYSRALAAVALTNIQFLKWGLAYSRSLDWHSLLDALHSYSPRVVTVAYADWQIADAPPMKEVVAYALQRRGGVLLIDTWCKSSPEARPLLGWLSLAEIEDLCNRCHEAGLCIALAGSLDTKTIALLKGAAPDWFAVRTAACDDGREGQVSETKVRNLAKLLSPSPSGRGVGVRGL